MHIVVTVSCTKQQFQTRRQFCEQVHVRCVHTYGTDLPPWGWVGMRYSPDTSKSTRGSIMGKMLRRSLRKNGPAGWMQSDLNGPWNEANACRT